MLPTVGTITVKDSMLIITATKTAHSKLVHWPEPRDPRKSQLLWRLFPVSLLFFFTSLGDLNWAANLVPCTFSQLKH